jgi:c(7)-type cytochrome triheme protein
MMRTRRATPELALALLLALLLPVRALQAEPGDVVLKRSAPSLGDFAPATFPHWIHRMQYKCPACHDELFAMKAGSSRFTMSDILAGKFCGQCHNGKLAFAATFATWNRCHRK